MPPSRRAFLCMKRSATEDSDSKAGILGKRVQCHCCFSGEFWEGDQQGKVKGGVL